MPPKYTYTYFNVKGRGEIARLIFAAAGVKYEDKRIEFADWPKLKPETPLGALPILEFGDGHKYPESVSITRHLAREFGLDGKTNIEKLQADIIVDLVITLREDFIKTQFEKDETRKAEIFKKFAEETAPKIFGFIEGILKKSKTGFVCGGQLTYCDIVLASFADMLHMKAEDEIKKYAGIIAHQKKFEALPKIAEYIKNRPITTI